MPETLKIDGKLNVHIYCATHVVMDSVADKILLPTQQGGLMILKGRAPLFTAVSAGVMWVYNKGLPPEAYYIDAGIAEVRRDICSVLAWAMAANKMDLTAIKARLNDQTTQLEKARQPTQKIDLQNSIAFLQSILNRSQHLTPPRFE